MATETGDPTFLQQQLPQQPPPQQAVTATTYPQMILEAVRALDDKNGASKSAISKQIESVHSGQLPPNHAIILSHNLDVMKSTGQLVFAKNNYSIPDPNAPPRRGRGRPPKPKDPSAPPPAAAAAGASSSTRGRGRPPKLRDPLAPPPPPKAKPPSSGRPRGRPPKKAKTDDGAGSSAPAPAPAGERRGRGRPPKAKPPVATPVAG